MNKKSLLAIEKILISLNELEIMCFNRDDKYFYDSYEMPILCELVRQIEVSLNKISKKLKNKYKNVNWQIIEQYKEDDAGTSIIKLADVWDLSSAILSKKLKQSLLNILKKELPSYYTNYCHKKHNSLY